MLIMSMPGNPGPHVDQILLPGSLTCITADYRETYQANTTLSFPMLRILFGDVSLHSARLNSITIANNIMPRETEIGEPARRVALLLRKNVVANICSDVLGLRKDDE